MAIGKMYNAVISRLRIGNLQIEWSNCIKYLGVYVVNCKHIKSDTNRVKRAFYAACNSIFSHIHGTSEIAMLTLQETYSLSVLLYAAPALTLQRRQIDDCLEDEREDYQNCSVLCCITQLCTIICTFM